MLYFQVKIESKIIPTPMYKERYEHIEIYVQWLMKTQWNTIPTVFFPFWEKQQDFYPAVES